MFREVMALLEAKKVPFAVGGALALQKHTGICRETKDFDVFLASEGKGFSRMGVLNIALRRRSSHCAVVLRGRPILGVALG